MIFLLVVKRTASDALTELAFRRQVDAIANATVWTGATRTKMSAGRSWPTMRVDCHRPNRAPTTPCKIASVADPVTSSTKVRKFNIDASAVRRFEATRA